MLTKEAGAPGQPLQPQSSLCWNSCSRVEWGPTTEIPAGLQHLLLHSDSALEPRDTHGQWPAEVHPWVRLSESAGDGHVSGAGSGAVWCWGWKAENRLQESQICLHIYWMCLSFLQLVHYFNGVQVGSGWLSNHVCLHCKLELHCYFEMLALKKFYDVMVWIVPPAPTDILKS